MTREQMIDAAVRRAATVPLYEFLESVRKEGLPRTLHELASPHLLAFANEFPEWAKTAAEVRAEYRRIAGLADLARIDEARSATLIHIPEIGKRPDPRAATFACAACHTLVAASSSAASVEVWAKSPRQCTRHLHSTARAFA